MATVTVSTSAALAQALSSAHGGDTIELAPGVYSPINLNEVSVSGGVTITSENAADPAVITSLYIYNSSGLNFANLEFSTVGSTDFYPFRVYTSHDISFSNLNVHGVLNNNPAQDLSSLLIQDSSQVTVANSYFHDLQDGISQIDDNGLYFVGNTFNEIEVHGIQGSGSSNVVISRNSFTNFFPQTGDHPDGIIFWTDTTAPAARNIVISDNVVTRGSGGLIQGIMLADSVGNRTFQNVSIEDNTVIGGMYNGIYATNVDGLNVTGNTVEGFSDEQSWIRLGLDSNVTLQGNSAENYIYGVNQALTSLSNSVTAASSQANTVIVSSDYVTPVGTTQVFVSGTGLTVAANPLGGDTLTSLDGGNILIGGLGGHDVFRIFSPDNKIVVARGTPDETLETWVSFTLPANVKNIEAEGSANVSLVGNAINNYIQANSGSDRLTGGAGADTFAFLPGHLASRITNFKAGDRIAISSYVALHMQPTIVDRGTYTSITFSNGDVVNLTGVHATSLTVAGDFIDWVATTSKSPAAPTQQPATLQAAIHMTSAMAAFAGASTGVTLAASHSQALDQPSLLAPR